MSTLKLSAKLFFRNIFLVLVTGAGIGLWLYQLISVFVRNIDFRYESGYYVQLDELMASQRIFFYIFILFLFISYEFVSKARLVNAEETLLTAVKKKHPFYLGQIGFLLILNFFIFVVVALYNIISLKYFFIGYRDVIIYSVLLSFVTYFLNCSAAIFIGSALALRFNRVIGYAVIVAFSLLISPLPSVLASALAMMSVNVYPLLSIFEFYLANAEYTPNLIFWLPNLPYRWALPIVWCLLAIIISVPKLFPFAQKNKTKRTVIYVMLAVLLAVNCAVALVPSSQVEKNEDPTQGDYHDFYYYDVKGKKQESEKADFCVTDYDISMKIRNRLYMDVKITVDNTELDEYKFTLYHGYKISKIKDDKGQKLKYTRENDCLTVYTEGDTRCIEFVYSGYSPVYYSNLQGTSLAGDFAYYPIPGWHALYNSEQQALSPVLLDKEAEFEVEIDAPYEIFCNLGQNDDGKYRGKSNALTIASGFIREYQIQDTAVIASYLSGIKAEKYLNSGINEMHAVESELDSEYRIKGKKIIFVSAENQHGSCTLASDHVIMRSHVLNSTDYKEELKSINGG